MVLYGISLPGPKAVFVPLLWRVIPIINDIIKMKIVINDPILLRVLVVGFETFFFFIGINLNKSWNRPNGHTQEQVVFPRIEPKSRKMDNAR